MRCDDDVGENRNEEYEGKESDFFEEGTFKFRRVLVDELGEGDGIYVTEEARKLLWDGDSKEVGRELGRT